MPSCAGVPAAVELELGANDEENAQKGEKSMRAHSSAHRKLTDMNNDGLEEIKFYSQWVIRE
jgi:hypothetical protein